MSRVVNYKEVLGALALAFAAVIVYSSWGAHIIKAQAGAPSPRVAEVAR